LADARGNEFIILE